MIVFPHPYVVGWHLGALGGLSSFVDLAGYDCLDVGVSGKNPSKSGWFLNRKYATLYRLISYRIHLLELLH